MTSGDKVPLSPEPAASSAPPWRSRQATVGARQPVRALVPSEQSTPQPTWTGLELEVYPGQILRSAETIRPAMAGVRYVFHVAADYRLCAEVTNEIVTNNVTGTRIMMEEALRAGVEPIVYTSSVATLAVRTDGTSVDETAPLDEAKAIGAYKRSRSRPSAWSSR